MNYLIVSPVRSGSSWLNSVLETHYKLYNVGETLCKISPDFVEDDQATLKAKYHDHQISDGYRKSMVKMWSEELRNLPRDEQIDFIAKKKPIVAKFTPWDLYEDEKLDGRLGNGYRLEVLQEKWAPLTTIFLYRKNLVEHFLSFLAFHQTGIGNATSQFMQYQRPVSNFTDNWITYHKMHMEFMDRCYRDHKFDHTVAYEDLFNMEELCGIPLKQYEGQFTFKLNKYTREEKDEVIRRTGYSENYELH